MINQYINIGQDSAATIGVGTFCNELCADCQPLTLPIFLKLISSHAEEINEFVGIAEHSVMPVVACANSQRCNLYIN